MFTADDSSTPEQPPQQQAVKPLSIVDPFQDDFFDQPFNPCQLDLDLLSQQDTSVTFETSDPFSSPDVSVLSDGANDMNDDPFAAFEFNIPINVTPTTTNNPTISSVKEKAVVEQHGKGNEIPAIPPDPLGVRESMEPSPLNNDQQAQSSGSNPLSVTASVGTAADTKDRAATKGSWTTFEDVGFSDLNKTKKRSSMYESSLQHTDCWSSDTVKEQSVSPLRPPPRNRRKSSRPHTVYGGQGVQTHSQAQKQTPNRPKFDLASIKPKTPTSGESVKDPFMDLFMRKPDDDIANLSNDNSGLEYESTHF